MNKSDSANEPPVHHGEQNLLNTRPFGKFKIVEDIDISNGHRLWVDEGN